MGEPPRLGFDAIITVIKKEGNYKQDLLMRAKAPVLIRGN